MDNANGGAFFYGEGKYGNDKTNEIFFYDEGKASEIAFIKYAAEKITKNNEGDIAHDSPLYNLPAYENAPGSNRFAAEDNGYALNSNQLAAELYLLIKDLYNARIDVGNNIVKLNFSNGECFTVKITENGKPEF